MAAITVSADANWESVTGKTAAGLDTITISNGATLTIDNDTFHSANPNWSSTFTLNAATGGHLRIDGSKVRLIPYNSGSGTVPAIGTTITQGGVSAYLLGVWSAINVPPTAVGAAMPASGFIKVKNKTGGNFAAGALSGIGASSTGADTVGWLIALLDTGGTAVTMNSGTFHATGEWFYLGETNGSRGQTLQLPYNSGYLGVAGIWIETSPGSDEYDRYLNWNAVVNANTPTDSIMGKVVWISSAGVVRIGNDGTNNVGYLPPSGCKVRIGNIFLLAASTSQAIGYNYTGTGLYSIISGGPARSQLKLDRVVTTSSVLYAQEIVNSVCASPNQFYYDSYVRDCIYGIGPDKTSTGFFTTMHLYVGRVDFDGITLGLPSTNGSSSFQTNAASGVIRNITVQLANTAENVSYAAFLISTNSSGIEVDGLDLIGARAEVSMSTFTAGGISDVAIRNVRYASVTLGSTTTAQTSAITVGARNVNGVLIDGVSLFPGATNKHPYAAMVTSNSARNVKIRNIGSRAAPVNIGSANVMGTGVTVLDKFDQCDVQRVFVSGTPRLGYALFINNPVIGVTTVTPRKNKIEHIVDVGYGSSVIPTKPHMTAYRGMAGTLSLTSNNAVDVGFSDIFTSATTGTIVLPFNAANYFAAEYEATAGSPSFDYTTARLRLGKIGDQIVFTMPYFAIGHTGFANSAPTLTGGTASNFTFEFQYDVGFGFNGSWLTMNGTNLSAVTVDPTIGVKLKIRMTCTTANTEDLTFLTVSTTSTSAAQENMYPINVISIAFSGIQAGTEIRAYEVATGDELFGVETCSADHVVTDIPYDGADIPVTIRLIHPDYRIKEFEYTVTGVDQVIPVQQEPDKWYSNPA